MFFSLFFVFFTNNLATKNSNPSQKHKPSNQELKSQDHKPRTHLSQEHKPSNQEFKSQEHKPRTHPSQEHEPSNQELKSQ